jgi:YrbI family 3-deoxy-D-manno-octulosonate 8-phosphate phosphatase
MEGIMIKAVVCDVDGCLTDGGMYCNGEGLMFKKFNTRDASSVHRLKKSGIKFFIITSASCPVTRHRVKSMNPDRAWFGCENKLQAAKEYCAELAGCDFSESAIYIGDDAMDIEAMREAYISCCPGDAIPSVQKVSHIVCERYGGEGVLAEVVDLLLTADTRIKST